ncbi:hypothetical protein CCACVL1_29941, partial [Corchorus capsularis]
VTLIARRVKDVLAGMEGMKATTISV